MRFVRVLIISTFFSTALIAVAAVQPPTVRLDDDVQPQHVVLDLTLSPAKPDFSGKIQFEVKINRAVDHFWINATQLELRDASLLKDGKSIPAQVIPGDEDFVGFQFPSTLQPGNARLTVSFSGKVNQRSSEGIFQSNRRDDKYLFTQFEAISARRAFPCFDQPNFKIPWQLTLHVPTTDSAVANTKIVKETPEADGMKAVEFTETKPLPSYLVAFGVGPFAFVDAGTFGSRHVPVRIVVPRGDEAEAKYAASITAEILTRLENYFGVPYPYDKADQLVIPLSFGGAMENPGLVTYDASIVLSPPGQETVAHQREYASIAAHELAHQWTGDMVTMKWWNDVWLNESFATWMSAKLLAEWKPEWHTRADDEDARLGAILQDTKTSARRINQPVVNKSDIASAFDGITYEKGGSVLATFENAVGPRNFQRAMHNYLEAHMFGNATAQDFLAALGAASKPEYATAFSTFLDQTGVPEIKGTMECAAGKAPTVHIAQQRLLPAGSSGTVNRTWGVPVCVAYADSKGRGESCKLVTQPQDTIALQTKSCPAWYLANDKEIGYYTAQYEADGLNRLLDHRNDLSLAEQVGLLGDVNNLARTSQMSWNDALALVPKLKNAPEPQVTGAAIDLASVPTEYLDPKLKQNYAAFVEDTFGEQARRLGWLPKSGDTEDQQLLRPQLVRFVATWGMDPELISEAKRLANAWLADHKAVPPDVARSVLAVAARNGDAQFYDKVLAAAKAETDPTFKPTLIGTLGQFSDPQLLNRSVALAFDGTFDIRMSGGIVFSMLREPSTADIAYRYVREHYDEIKSKLPQAVDTDFAAFFPILASASTCSDQGEAEAKTFFEPRMKEVVGGPRQLANSLEQIHLCAVAKPAAEKQIDGFLANYTPGAAQNGGR